MAHKRSGSPSPSSQLDAEAEVREGVEKRLLPPYHVVLLDDNDHTYSYVIHMLQSLFGTPREEAWRRADELNNRKRVIVCTTSKERAELKRDQIHAFGPDPRVKSCAGSMSAVIEPAEG